MVKKLLSIQFLAFCAFMLTSGVGWGQECPTSVSISADPGTTICAGTEVTFTANINGGQNPIFQWQVNGNNVGTNSNSYSDPTLSNTDKVKVIVSSGNTDSSCSEESNTLTFTVNAVQTPTVGITASKTSICPGENITFSASPTNQGSSPSYEWFINGTSVQNSSSSNLNNPSGLDQGENTVRVIMQSSLNCVTTEKVEKTISYTVKPVATISATTSTDIESCINTAITPIKFDIGGGGTGATVSGLPPGLSGSFSGGIYTISGSPTSSGTFDFTVNTTGTCEQTSATGSIKVNPNATLSLTSGNNTQTVCAAGGVADGSISPITYSIGETGTGATVTDLPTGITDSYSNGVLTINGSSSVSGTHNYTVTAFGSCGNSSSLTGSITITANVEPSVSITSSETDNEICEGTSVTFTATPTNGGSSPSYQWQINDSNAGSNSRTFTTSSLTDGQTVTVIMTSNETCRTKNTASSNGISTKVNENLVPSVTIDVDNTDICSGDEVIFTAQPVNGGTSPTFQWKVGNTVVGSGESYSTSSLSNGQSVTVTMTSSETCVTSSTATSEPVVMEVNENLVPSVALESNDENNTICTGGSISFTATPTNGGFNPQYQWQINGNASGGVTTSNTFSSANLNDGDIVTVVVVSSEECLVENNVVSNEIPVQVDISVSGETPVWDVSDASYNPTAICPSVSGLKYKIEPITGATSYDWTLPSGWSITNGNGTNEITVTASVNANAGNVRVNGRTECGTSQETSIAVTTGTAAHVGAGPDQTVCPGTTQINLVGEIGGVITQHKDWDWFASVNGGNFTSDGFSHGGNALDGTYSIPTSVQDGGTVTIRIESVKPAGNCDIKTDEMTITIESAASITDASNKDQTVCINSEIEDISFTVGGAGKGATTGGLPAGITGNFEDGIFTLSGTPTEAGTFNYTVTTTGECTNASRTGTLTVNPRPTFTRPEEVFVCAGSQTSTISFEGSSVSGTSYQWTNDNSSIGLADSGTGNINSFTAINNTNEPVIANISVTPIADNCEGTTEEFQITVYPTATFTTPDNISVCNGENLEDIVFAGSNVQDSTFKWSNSNTAIGLGAEGTGNIPSFSATNTTNQPIEATITVTPVANECDGTPEEFTITVNPTPAFTAPDNVVVCNGEELSEMQFAGASVSGTAFNWTNNNIDIGLAASGTGSLPSFTASNNGTEPVNATITVIPAANECEGEPMTFEITVNPTPTVNSIEDVIVCNGEDFSEIVLSSTVTGTSYSWTNSNSAIGLAESGTGNIPAFSAKNEAEAAITSTITVTPTANGCEGTPFTFEITVNPSVIIDAGPDQTICSNGVAPMAASLGGGASEGTWTTSGSGTFNNNSINAEYTPSDSDALNGSVILTFTSNDPDGPCGNASDTMELFINEEVLITTQPQNSGICSTEPSELTVIASGDNLSYEWKRTDGANITNSNGIYSSTLSFNNTTSTNSGEYYVIVRGEDACNEGELVESARVTINVDENIIIEEPITEVPICGDGFSEVTMKFTAHANGAPLTFTWYKDNVEIDESSDSNITISTGSPDGDGRYEGTLHLANITTDYNGDYYVEISGPEEFTCSTAVTNPFQLRLNEMPELPVVEDLVVCQNETPEAFTVTTGTDLKWYLNEADTEFIVNESGQPTAPVPSTDVPGDFYYWVTQQPEACESEKVQVKVTVKEKPELPEVEENIYYCLGDTTEALSATGTDGATLNWYESETGEATTSAPTPSTGNPGETTYWVSQTPNDGFGCESERAEITVTVYSLPEVTASVEESVICLGTPAELAATGGVSYIWYDGEEVIGNEPTISHTPTVAKDYEFTVVVTDGNGCQNTAKVNVQVDDNTVAGTLSGPETGSVCVTSPNGTLSLAGSTGEIQRWEKSEDGGATWTSINETSETYEFKNLTQATSFRAIVKNGVCGEEASDEINITIDPLPEGGKLAFTSIVTAENDGRIFIICEENDPGYADPLSLLDSEGQVVAWRYRGASDTSWSVITDGEGENFTGSVLEGSQIESVINANLNSEGKIETTVFMVELRSGACGISKFSETAIVSVIPSTIEPTPVEVDPDVVCIGESINLYAETGYENGTINHEAGMFDNASITNNGWRLRREGSTEDLGFSSSANNTVPDFWLRTNPKDFLTATKGETRFSPDGLGNNPFGIVGGNHPSTLEPPVFSLDGTDQAILTFDQAYDLTEGASIRIEISTNGGASYNTDQPLYEVLGPASSGNYGNFGAGPAGINQMQIDLGEYIGQNNLRIRFRFLGKRDGDIWAFDNIDIPDGPRDVGIEWNDYTDPENPELIGYSGTETWTPTKIGLNTFVVKTLLTTNSNGEQCDVVQHEEKVEVFVYDSYTSTPTAAPIACGVNNVSLTATVTGGKQGAITNYPTADGYVGYWEIVKSPEGYNYDVTQWSGGITNPSAVFTPNIVGAYTLRWVLELEDETAASECKNKINEVTFTIFDKYTSTATATVEGCGDNSVELTGILSGVLQGNISTLPTPDGTYGEWQVIDGPEGYEYSADQFSDINDPAAVFTPNLVGDYTLRWAIINGNNTDCEHSVTDVTITVYDLYTSTATAVLDTCETNSFNLSAVVSGALQGEIGSFPTPDGTTGKWEVTASPDGYTFSESHFSGGSADPNAIFTPVMLGEYTLSWILVNENLAEECIVPGTASFKLFDKYTLTAEAVAGSCGDFSIELTGTTTGMWQENISYPTQDGYIGQWRVEGGEGTFSNPDPEDPSEPVNNPGAIFTATDFGNYTFYWELIPDPNFEGEYKENTSCPAIPAEVVVELKECIALDFDGIDDFVDLGEGYTGNYSLEAWILPKEPGGTIISGPTFNITTPDGVSTSQWTHVAVSNGKLYIDGVHQTNVSVTGNGGTKTLIGARWTEDGATDFFNGWIEEVRIWNGEISQENIRFTMNQRLKPTGNIGVVVDMDHPDSPDYAKLAGYYQLLATEEGILPGGYTPDLANSSVDGKLMNMETLQENTAPLPYFTANDGSWDTAATWARPNVWKLPNTSGIDWNIVQALHNVTANRNISVLGLISEENTLDIQGANPDNWTSGGSGNQLYISHYLLLNGVIDLSGESQLVQPMLSIVDENSIGTLYRDQQGTASSYNYNYWSSPVSPGTNNVDYNVDSVMKDGSNFNTDGTPKDLDFGDAYAYADGTASNPRKISSYWLHKFHGTANNYYSWEWIGAGGPLNVGEGYSMKGTTGPASISASQNYTFEGIPNNGDISPGTIGTEQNYLVGNPYPSAIDAHKFIRDNMKDISGGENSSNIFNGTLYFWSHFANKTHYLQEYVGGYATYNLSGGVRAVAIDERINATEAEGGQMPQQYIPVGQGFFVNTQLDAEIADISSTTVHGGQITFKNSQRIYMTEGDANQSVFHSQEKKGRKSSSSGTAAFSDERRKIWLKFKSPKGYHRQILVTADANATDGFDLGYDAPMIEDNVEDMYWYFSNYQFVIQGVKDFNIDRELNLGIKVEEKGSLTIKIDQLMNIPDDMEIFLRDSLLQVTHDLRAEDYVTESEGGTFIDRFKMVFKDKTAVVIEEPDEPVLEDGEFEILYINGSREVLVRNPQLLKISRIYLNNMLGQQVHVYYDIPAEREVRLPVARFSSGVYVVKVHSEEGIVAKKVILE